MCSHSRYLLQIAQLCRHDVSHRGVFPHQQSRIVFLVITSKERTYVDSVDTRKHAHGL